MPDDAPALISLPATDLCLGFVNTLGWRGRPHPSETLNDINDLKAWLRKSAGMAEALPSASRWNVKPKERAAVLAEALAGREALFGLFQAIAAGSPAPKHHFARLQRTLAATPERRRIIPAAGGFAWQIGKMQFSMPCLLAPVLWSAADLLVSEARNRVRLCANRECLWLFLDASRNATRVWCDMAACGNRAKARRHYLRSKEAGPLSS